MKAREIFALALALMGERSEGASYQTEEFSHNAIECLNVLACELDELDCALKRIRPDADNRLSERIASWEDESALHPLICRSVLPYGLCHLLLLEEDPSRAAQFLKRYQAQRDALKRRFDRPVRHGIRNVYGSI